MTLREELAKKGYLLLHKFLTQKQCEDILEIIRQYGEKYTVPRIKRPAKPIPLIYSVIDGDAIHARLPEIVRACKAVDDLVDEAFDHELVPLRYQRARYNINITEPGGSYRWHYDVFPLTGLLYLNSVEQGELVFHPGYRIRVPGGLDGWGQRWADRLLLAEPVKRIFSKPVTVKPEPGLLFLFHGMTTLHSVRQVTGHKSRVVMTFGYDYPNAEISVRNQLNEYLFTPDNVGESDPNYLS